MNKHLIFLSSIKKSTRLSITQFIDTLEKCTINALTVSAILATAAIVVGVMFQTGFIVNASSAVIRIAQGVLPFAILLTMLMSYSVGMCLPITVSYILISILGVPAFVDMGVPVIAAHMSIFWFSQVSTISPPVCMTAFVAADIAGAPRYKTGFTTLLFAKGIYIIPFMMIYTKILTGNIFEKLSISIIIGLGLVSLTIAFDGLWKKYFVNVYGRLIAGLSSVILFYSSTFDLLKGKGLLELVIGLIFFIIVFFVDKIPVLQIKGNKFEEYNKL